MGCLLSAAALRAYSCRTPSNIEGDVAQMIVSEHEPPTKRRKLLWTAFWFVFLTTPPLGGYASLFAEKYLSIQSFDLATRILFVLIGAAVSGALITGVLLSRI